MNIATRTTFALALLVSCAGGCSGDDDAAPFFEPPDEADAGGVPGPIDNTPPDDFVSSWATLDDPDQLCTGWEHSCGIDVSGKVQCWGGKASLRDDIPADTFQRIACGDYHVCGITTKGTVKCWGNGSDPAMMAGAHHRQAVPPKGTFKAITAGSLHSCGVQTDGKLVCWGAGGPDAKNGTAPHLGQAMAPTGTFLDVSAGEAHTCAVRGDKKVVCWGGTGERGDCFPPGSYNCGQTDAPSGEFAKISSGLGHSCALTTTGELRCWGAGKIDANCDPNSSDAVRYDCGQSIELSGEWKRMDVGHHHTCVIDDAGHLECFGWNYDHAIEFSDETVFAQVSAGHAHTCAVQRNGVVVCKGANESSQSKVPNTFPGMLQ